MCVCVCVSHDSELESIIQRSHMKCDIAGHILSTGRKQTTINTYF